jgi:hypothetical protein
MMIIKGPRLVHAFLVFRWCCILFLAVLAFSPLPAAPDRLDTAILVRNAHAIAYDIAREQAVLFGGADDSKVCGDTWEWNGNKWIRVSVTGPEPRTFPAMTYDSLRKKVVLFGGNRVLFGKFPDEDTFLNDTWEWDGETWRQIKVPGPPPRAEAAIAFDGYRGRVVLFGGYNLTKSGRTRLGDTWEWDGSRWTQIKVAAPSPRNGAAQVYDSNRRRTILFGGSTEEGVSGETWEWDGKQWRENRGALTEGRFNCVLAYDSAVRKVIRFGGRYAGKPVGDTWEYDGKEWKKLNSVGPTPRNHTAMVYDSKHKRVVLFGGHDFGMHEDGVNVFGDTWEWDGRKWIQKDVGETRKRIDNDH